MRARVKRLEQRRRSGRRALAAAAAGTFALALGSGRARAEEATEAPVVHGVSATPEPPARPRELPPLDVRSPPFTRHVDLGGGVALVHRFASDEPRVRYPAAVGMALWARVDVTRWLRANLYALRTERDMALPAGALGLAGDPGDVEYYAYSFGLRLAPTWHLSSRARAWASAGAGWGRLEHGRFSVVSPSGVFLVRERSASYVELPLGVGASFDVVPRWLAVELETSGVFYVGQRGRAFDEAQAVDASGRRVTVGAFPRFDGGFVTTLGLSLVL
ncbi:hypothetical protein [Polyangium spumosum]|uniref:Outer membrane beta-barrel protein n=1 Tax=Polyangium spumosum TaxID=889282 RepID=A0A6N7PVP7_9BACT|nr:hypothetical protein [Polyangium spumosum]MRG94144.1 hypothetical protein [Polyangium spumosum]